jgi:chromosome segregation ATPase
MSKGYYDENGDWNNGIDGLDDDDGLFDQNHHVADADLQDFWDCGLQKIEELEHEIEELKQQNKAEKQHHKTERRLLIQSYENKLVSQQTRFQKRINELEEALRTATGMAA